MFLAVALKTYGVHDALSRSREPSRFPSSAWLFGRISRALFLWKLRRVSLWTECGLSLWSSRRPQPLEPFVPAPGWAATCPAAASRLPEPPQAPRGRAPCFSLRLPLQAQGPLPAGRAAPPSSPFPASLPQLGRRGWVSQKNGVGFFASHFPRVGFFFFFAGRGWGGRWRGKERKVFILREEDFESGSSFCQPPRAYSLDLAGSPCGRWK